METLKDATARCTRSLRAHYELSDTCADLDCLNSYKYRYCEKARDYVESSAAWEFARFHGEFRALRVAVRDVPRLAILESRGLLLESQGSILPVGSSNK